MPKRYSPEEDERRRIAARRRAEAPRQAFACLTCLVGPIIIVAVGFILFLWLGAGAPR